MFEILAECPEVGLCRDSTCVGSAKSVREILIASGPCLASGVSTFCLHFKRSGSGAGLEQTLQRDERLQNAGLPAGCLLDEAAFRGLFAIPAFVNDGQRQPVELHARLGIDGPVIMRQKVFANLWNMRVLERHGLEDAVRGAAHIPVNGDEASLDRVPIPTEP